MSANIGVDGVARNVTQICIGVDGVARNVVFAYMGIDGVAREIYAARGKKLSDFAVGESVFLNVGGTLTEFIVVNHGIPEDSSLYDSSCAGSWLLAKDIYIKMAYDATKSNNVYSTLYSASDLHEYLNGDFFALLDAKVQNKIKQVKIPYIAGLGESSYVASGANGLSAKIFALSVYEAGFEPSYWSSSDGTVYYKRKDGACLEYFKTNSALANFDGTATQWWLRTPKPEASQDIINTESLNAQMCYVRATGGDGITNNGYTSYYTYYAYGVRPALIMSGNTRFDEETHEIV